MLFTDMPVTPPAVMTTRDFILRPIVAADAALDYAAVMESRDYLRTWEQSSWPADDFTVAANREDLELLEQRHTNREAFTYTVMDPAGTECLGCVYLMPPDARAFVRARITAAGDCQWKDYGAAVYFWVRASRLESHLDRTLLDALRTWLSKEWGFSRHLFVTNEQFVQQVAMFEDAHLRLQFTITEPGKPGAYLAYA